MKQMNADELRTAHAAGDWNALWLQAMPIVKYSIRKLLQAGHLSPERATDDLLQEGYLAAGAAVRRWNPTLGMFSTWISHAVRGAMLDHLRKEARGIMSGHTGEVSIVQMDDDLTHNTEAHTPATEHQRDTDAMRVRVALSALSSDEQLIVKRYFGVDCDPEPMKMICHVAGLSNRQTWRVLNRALKKMAQSVNGTSGMVATILAQPHRSRANVTDETASSADQG